MLVTPGLVQTLPDEVLAQAESNMSNNNSGGICWYLFKL